MRLMPVRRVRARGAVVRGWYKPCYRGGLYARRSPFQHAPGPMTRGHSPKLSTGRAGALLAPFSGVRRSRRPLRSAPGISRWRYVMA